MYCKYAMFSPCDMTPDLNLLDVHNYYYYVALFSQMNSPAEDSEKESELCFMERSISGG